MRQTDVVGALNGPINMITVGQAIAKLGGKHTTNLRITINEDVTIGIRTFKAGTLLSTGLDVPANSLVPLGMRASLTNGRGHTYWVDAEAGFTTQEQTDLI
ncbi:hypothetical protein LC653_37715 [Nostoc sp. CHAB 5784]|uniref:hypothetical protein n=1 Tax=Nostoc mirabile TaxID=2907820 RepID=UPI001E2B8E6A|nr:hypothetical protein [Nostoc mirabile]MCC5669422.1 hypothetical protein [Nostoc mirabile CHAB5784]